MKIISYLQSKSGPVACFDLSESISEFANLSLHELQNIRCTSEQHKVVGFLIDIKKFNDGIIACKNDFVVTEIKKFYQDSLKLNSPVESDTIL